MQESSESQLREAVAAAGNTRFDDQADVVASPDLLKYRGDATSALRSLFGDAGVDVRQMENVQEQWRAELDRVAEQLRLDAVAKSTESREMLHGTHDHKQKLIDSGRAISPNGIKLEHGPIMLDRPFLIQPTHAIISGEQTARFDSWAKTKFTQTKSGEEGVSFFYAWENPNDDSVTIDVVTSLGFNGFCRVHAEGAFYDSSETRLRIFCALVVRPWSQQPHQEVGDLKDVTRISARSLSLLDDDKAARVLVSHDLRSSSHSWITIEPKELVVFEVAVIFHSVVDGYGYASVDFDDDNFAISSPYLAIGVWNP